MLKTSSLCSIRILNAFVLSLWLGSAMFAQSTAFTYQGRLTDGANLASGFYDFEFKLYDLQAGGSQQGSTQTLSNVTVTNGTFTVQLDFGSGVFTANTARFLEIGVRTAGGPAFTTLTSRASILPSPYAIQTLNATQLGGVAASQYVQTSDARLSDARTPNGSAGGDLTGSYPSPTVGPGKITSAKILDGEIVNADISGSAGISTSKISGLGSLATLSPTGSASSSTFLRGDNSWAAPASGAPVFVSMSSLQTISTTTPTFASLMNVSLAANKTYFLEVAVIGQRNGATSGQGTCRLSYSGALNTDMVSVSSNFFSAGSISNTTFFDQETAGLPGNWTLTQSIKYEIKGYVRTTTAGTLAVQCAKATGSAATALDAREGSYILATPLN